MKHFVYLMLPLFAISCSKENTPGPVPPSSIVYADQVKLLNTTLENLDEILFIKITSTGSLETISGYDAKVSGQYKIIFHGQNGASNLLRGTAGPMSSTGIVYPIAGQDTFRIIKKTDNTIFQTVVLNLPNGNPNRRIYSSKKFSGSNEQETTDLGNAFVRDSLGQLLFNKVF